METPSARSLFDCSNTTAFSPTLLQFTRKHNNPMVTFRLWVQSPDLTCFVEGFDLLYTSINLVNVLVYQQFRTPFNEFDKKLVDQLLKFLQTRSTLV